MTLLNNSFLFDDTTATPNYPRNVSEFLPATASEDICELYQSRVYLAYNNARSKMMLEPGAWVFVVIFALSGVIGILGNAITIYVYAAKVKRTSSSFVIALAVVDFIVCAVVVPLRFAAVLLLDVGSDFVCKGGEFIFFLTIPMSCFILLAIAVERFVVICLSKANWLTPNIVKATLVAIFIASVAIGIPSIFTVSIYKDVPHPFKQGVIVPCNFGLCRPIYTHITREEGWIYWVVQASIFLVMTVALLVAYSTIFMRVLKARSKLTRWKPSRSSTAANNAASDVGIENTAEATARTETVELSEAAHGCLKGSSSDNKMDCCKSEASKLLRANNDDEDKPNSKSRLRESSGGCVGGSQKSKMKKRLPHVTTAIALCLVTGAFIIAYMPIMIITLTGICAEDDSGESHTSESCEWHHVGGILWHFYLLNHAANPIIYTSMNPRFKQALQSMLKRSS